MPSLNYQLKPRPLIGKQIFYTLVLLQLGISIGSLLGTNLMRSEESTVLAQRAAMTPYRYQLDGLQTQMGGARGSVFRTDELRRMAATSFASSLRRLGDTAPAVFASDLSMISRQTELFGFCLHRLSLMRDGLPTTIRLWRGRRTCSNRNERLRMRSRQCF